MSNREIAVVIATVGRAEALRVCLRSLASQTILPAEVIVVHSGSDAATKAVCDERRAAPGLAVRYCTYPENSTALQRDFATRKTRQPLVMFADDDMEFSPSWIEALLGVLDSDPRIGAVMGCIENQQTPVPTLLWRVYRRLIAPADRAVAPGAVIGAAVHNGFPREAVAPMAAEWLGGGITLLRREAYLSVNGFAPYFDGSSPGEDVDLGFRMSRRWAVRYVPVARCLHHQAATGRDHVARYQHLYMRSRYAFCRVSAGHGVAAALAHIALWAVFQTASELVQLRRGALRAGFFAACYGRLTGALSCLGWNPAREQFPPWHQAQIG